MIFHHLYYILISIQRVDRPTPSHLDLPSLYIEWRSRKGENVIPAGASLNNGNGTTNITLHMTVNGVTDVRDLVDKVQKEIEKRTGRMLRWST